MKRGIDLKKTGIVLVIAILLMSIQCYASDAYFDAEAIISDSNLVELNISLSKPEDVYGFRLNVIYDNVALRYQRFETGEIISEQSVVVNSDFLPNEIRIIYFDTKEIEKQENVLKLYFEVTEESKKSFAFTVSQITVADGDGEKTLLEDIIVSVGSEEEMPDLNIRTGGKLSGIPRRADEENVRNDLVVEKGNIPFADVKATDWFYDAVKYVYSQNLMNGTSDTTFEPLSEVTRGMFATVLYRLAGEPAFMNDNAFEDVKSGEYYEKAVVWAQGKGIVNGTSKITFEPEANITREEMATMLYRYIQYNGGGFEGDWAFSLNFKDAGQVSDWAYEAMCYLTMPSVGLMQGMEDETLQPKANTNRAELATILMRYCEAT